MEFSKEERKVIEKFLAAKYNEFSNVYNAVMEQQGFVNDHSGDFEPHTDYVVLWTGDGKYICPVWKSSVCCLNPLYVAEDGKVHVSRRSIGGNVEYGDVAKHNRIHGMYHHTHHFSSLECAEYFSTTENESNMPW